MKAKIIKKAKKTISSLPKPLARAIILSYRSLYNAKSRLWWNFYKISFDAKQNKKWNKAIKNKSILMHNTRDFFSKQFHNKNSLHDRYDIIVRYLALDQKNKKSKQGYDLYKKMQLKRDNKEIPKERLLDLAESIKEKGFDPSQPILVNRLKQLVDGSHRCACALYFDEEEIPLKVHGFDEKVVFGLDWFKEKGFTEDEIKLLKDKRKEIFIEKGITFPVVLWPPMAEYFDEIEQELSKKYFISKSDTYSFKDFLAKFTKELYAIDSIPLWQIEKKLKGMEKYKPLIKIIYLEVRNPKYRINEVGKEVSMTLEGIKRKYRKKYGRKVPSMNYHDAVHAGDNYFQNKEIATLLKNYDQSKLRK